jgi:tripartite-type tricarboxylate transporter receptor subunit TctC
MSVSWRRKRGVETRSIESKSRRTLHRPVGALWRHRDSVGVKAAELPRRRFLHLAAGAVAVPTSRTAWAQAAYPLRPINMIVPFAAGGSTDATGRILAEQMRASLGQPIVVENVSGAGGSIGTGRVARARPDGYTINIGLMSTQVLNRALYSLPYDVLNDFAPIVPLVTTPVVLFARNSMPANDLNELIAWLKTKPNTASAGITVGSIQLITAFFGKDTGAQFALVPYRGSAPAMQDLVAGQIDFLFDTPVQLPLVRAGSIKAYAVAGDRRLALAPSIPTFGELGFPAVSWTGWVALFAPRDTPRDIIGKLKTAAVEALANPAVRSRLIDLGLEIFPREQQTPEALDTLVKANAEKWLPLIKEFGIRAE